MLTAAEVDQYRVIDTDTHVIEPYDLWTSRLLGRQVAATRCRTSSGTTTSGGRVVLRRRADRRGGRPRRRPAGASTRRTTRRAWRTSTRRPGTPTARLERMDEYGVWAQVLYPNVAGFGAGQVAHARRPRADAGLRAGLQRLPGRVRLGRPQALHPDHGAAVLGHGADARQEIVRARRQRPQGRHHDRRADLLGAAADRRPVLGPAVGGRARTPACPINFHIGSGDMSIFDTRRAERAGRTPTTPASACSSAWPTSGSSPT